jgi:hypothetical protein
MTTPTLPPLDKPTSDDVAVLLRARTKDLDGVEVGVFNAYTRPTDVEVARIIDLAYAEVTGRVGVYIGSACATSAKALVVIRAAAWTELSFWPEQVRSDRSVYAELAEQWTTGLENVIACVQGDVPDAGGETKAGYRFGVLDVHGWTASPYYGAPEVPPPTPDEAIADLRARTDMPAHYTPPDDAATQALRNQDDRRP